ncbi:glutathionylspermidine synthase family protein [Falsirhodobacter halotolerans]|uniref:glutathionylspermidine synthase family protein n=1 Tax=Falsirhodobacter halotolerans TaxID=1146892 RepID=UPI001FD2CABF|nr:glutathionylspermidine synthase family protein [Falsirhodobacter halotolerans]MCJ8141161.1 glutathionylspermidine synthase family protein [Falsirhodobacter halotolerans]
MEKIALPERADWPETARAHGFTFADMHGEPYWDETSAYRFTLEEIETGIEAPATELHAMCREAVDAILADEGKMERMAIPRARWDFVASSWKAFHPELYGRMDLVYDGTGPAKLLEYNADTPTSLYESASLQWEWLEQQVERGALHQGDDQFNRIHEALAERFADIFPADTDIHFAAAEGVAEDFATVEAMAWAAREGGMGAHYTDLGKIGLSDQGQFTDAEDRVIGTLFKLYPWEDAFLDDFGAAMATSGCRFLEPPWKALVSNKAILPVLWEMFEGHPNLLPAFHLDDVAGALRDGTGGPAIFDRARDAMRSHVIKPVFSREGASVDIIAGGQPLEMAKDRAYDDHPKIVQAYAPLPMFDGFHPILGAWIVGETCVGLGIREDRAKITQDLSRFKPHLIRG